MKRYLVDNQLPAALAEWIRQSPSVEAEHVLDVGLAQQSDEIIWSRAASVGWVIVTKDVDFVNLSALRTEPVQVIWVRLGNCRTPVLLEAFTRAWPEAQRQIEAGVRVVELH